MLQADLLLVADRVMTMDPVLDGVACGRPGGGGGAVANGARGGAENGGGGGIANRDGRNDGGRTACPPTAVAVLDGRVLWVGRREEAAWCTGPATGVFDFGRATIVPGLIDAHVHTVSFGLALAQVDVRPAACPGIAEIQAAVTARARTTPPGHWILGRGYDQNRLRERRHPTRLDLDAAAPGHPVLLTHTSGHMAVANTLALRLAQVGPATAAPPGGAVVRDEAGEPTGLLLETAQRLMETAVPPAGRAAVREALRLAHTQLAREGLTGVHEAGCPAAHPDEIGIYQEALRAGELTARTYLMLYPRALADTGRPALGIGLGGGFGGGMLAVGPLKLMADGSLIGRTAVLDEPFEGQARPAPGEETGLWVTAPAELERLCTAGHAAGWQLATHAIGDRAIRVTLDAYDAAQRAAPRPGTRHRIEHCGVLTTELITRLAATGTIPVTQPRFIGELGDGFRRNLGERRTLLCYPLRSLLDAGIRVAAGSDRPVVEGAPLLGLHDAVNQKTGSGRPYVPDEAVTWREALGMFTANAAYAAFQEGWLGCLRPLMAADLTVIGGLPQQEPDRIAGMPVLGTMVAGRWTWLG